MAIAAVSSSSVSRHFISISPNPQPVSFFIPPFKLPNPSSSSHNFRLLASRRPPSYPQEAENPSRNWNRNLRNNMTFSGDYDEDEDEDEEEEDEEDDRSLDLLIRFVENVFKKVSKRARKSVRSVLPINIPTKLVGFSVNGVIILAFFWILKAFLEVVCTLGTVVFVSILVVRGVWTGISYFQEGSYHRTDTDFDDDNQAWTGAQPVA